MVFNHDFYSGMVHWYNNIWPDMGSLYIHNIWSILHEDDIRLQYTKSKFIKLNLLSRIFLISHDKLNYSKALCLKLQNGFMNGAPFLCSYLSSVVFCYAADFIISRNLMSLTNVRKMFTAICK